MSTEQVVETKKQRKRTERAPEVADDTQAIGAILQDLVTATTIASMDLTIWLYEKREECDVPESVIELVRALRELVSLQRSAVSTPGGSSINAEQISKILQDLLTAANSAALDLALYSRNEKCKLPDSLYEIIVALKKLFELQRKRK
jgi:hypothetical protein